MGSIHEVLPPELEALATWLSRKLLGQRKRPRRIAYDNRLPTPPHLAKRPDCHSVCPRHRAGECSGDFPYGTGVIGLNAVIAVTTVKGSGSARHRRTGVVRGQGSGFRE
jgi:hypothetical protein